MRQTENDSCKGHQGLAASDKKKFFFKKKKIEKLSSWHLEFLEALQWGNCGAQSVELLVISDLNAGSTCRSGKFKGQKLSADQKWLKVNLERSQATLALFISLGSRE
ncbi:hypothetical protein ElyMa_000356400 [Elysia marginata]|uniref:Uncharacterized protein n=1 Tax=Elysia marginata TaxID=1093978 RepID=A0AAV4FGT2_9GAST|nr:hypothetical protein ElyMa_000356400 [Elysia marginata]